MISASRLQLQRRRSVRMSLMAPVGVSGEDRQKVSFTVPARATNLNQHGAAVQINRELLVGSTVVLRNSRRTQASARIVAQVSAVQGMFTYGVEFLDDQTVRDFWGIVFPPQPS